MQLGVSDQDYITVPTFLIDDVIAIDANSNAGVITSSGDLIILGYNVLMENCAKFSLGNGFGIAEDNNGVLYSWGVNDYGQLGSQCTPSL